MYACVFVSEKINDKIWTGTFILETIVRCATWLCIHHCFSFPWSMVGWIPASSFFSTQLTFFKTQFHSSGIWRKSLTFDKPTNPARYLWVSEFSVLPNLEAFTFIDGLLCRNPTVLSAAIDDLYSTFCILHWYKEAERKRLVRLLWF